MKNFTTNPALKRLCPAFAFCLLTVPAAAASPAAAAATIHGLPVVVKSDSVSLTASTSIDVDESVSSCPFCFAVL